MSKIQNIISEVYRNENDTPDDLTANIATAEQIGMDAYTNGDKREPDQSDDLKDLVAGLGVGSEKAMVVTSFLRGWDGAKMADGMDA